MGYDKIVREAVMPRKKTPKPLIPLLSSSISTYLSYPPILFPFVTIAFIQLLILEILFFAPRYPLSAFFNPIVATLWGEQFIHYPDNFHALPKLFQYAQAPVYIFISSFLICTAIAVIAGYNDDRKIKFTAACRNVGKSYVHIIVAATISFCIFYVLHRLYGLAIVRAWQIESREGIFFTIRTAVLVAAPYVNLLNGVFVTTVFAFVFPLIVIENKKVFAAIGNNFKMLWGSFWYVFMIVTLPTLLYVPVLLLRGNIAGFTQSVFPEMRVIILGISVLVTMIIDATVYTAVTTVYLLKKEHS